MAHSERVFCNKCRRKQLFKVVASHNNLSFEGEIEITRTAEVLECGGCGYTILRRSEHYSEFQYSPGDMDPDPELVPGEILRQEPVWISSLSPNMREALSETIKATNNQMPFLAAIGVRTVLDMVLVSTVGDIGGFAAKLSQLESRKYVTSCERERLDVLADVGSAAAHRGYTVGIGDLNIIIDILEEVVRKLYIDPGRDKELSEHARRIGVDVPPRPKN